MRCETLTVLSNTKLAENIYRLTLPFAHKLKPSAGQFVMLKQAHATALLPRAISICDVVDDTLVLVYQVVGEATTQFTTLATGDSVTMTGPIGRGFPIINATDSIALVGGGVGVAPLLYTAKKLREKGIAVDIFLGFRDEPFLENEFSGTSDNLAIYTESGRSGIKGRVTDELDPTKYSAIYCCGPTPMMQAVIALGAQTPVFVSLETKMACGIGACRVCSCTTVEGTNLRTCLDGPVFLGKELNFNA